MVTRVCGAAAAAQVGNIHHGAGRDGQVPGPRAAQGARAPLLRLVPGPQHNVQYPGLEPRKVRPWETPVSQMRDVLETDTDDRARP